MAAAGLRVTPLFGRENVRRLAPPPRKEYPALRSSESTRHSLPQIVVSSPSSSGKNAALRSSESTRYSLLQVFRKENICPLLRPLKKMLHFALRMIHVIHSRGLVFVKENILRLVPPLKKKIVHFALQDITRVFVKENIRCFLPPLKKRLHFTPREILVTRSYGLREYLERIIYGVPFLP